MKMIEDILLWCFVVVAIGIATMLWIGIYAFWKDVNRD